MDRVFFALLTLLAQKTADDVASVKLDNSGSGNSLRLKLEKVPVDIIVVDHMERAPTEN
jgi:hypothetical protein